MRERRVCAREELRGGMGREREMAVGKGVPRMPGGPEWLHVRGRVELRSDEDGYAGAWFEVEIERLFPASKQAYVEYIHFVGDSGAAHKEFARVDNLRPLAPVLPARVWRPRDSVETYYKNAWWVGYIKARVAHDPDKYLVYYGRGEQDLEIYAQHIRPRQNYTFPSPDDPKGSWSLARPMQSPAIWERTEAPPPVAKIQPRRVSAPASSGAESDGSWNAREEARRRRKKRKSASKSTSRSAEPKRKIRFVSRPKALTIMHALPAVGAKAAEQQSTLVLTPGSSPPPFQDCAVSPGSDSKPPPTRSSSSNFSSSSSGSGNSGSSSSSDDDANASANGEDEPIFPDFSREERVRNLAAYQQLLLCFRLDSKGMLDSKRHNILTAVRCELKLSAQDVNDAHCAVFGMPGM